jgi:hypothetical protein
MAGKEIWLDNLQGMIQRQDMDKIPLNYSPLLVNVSNSKPGTWGKRSGSVILGTDTGGNGVDGLIAFSKLDGTTELSVIRGTNLELYDTTTDSWTGSILASYPNSNVEGVNYRGQKYWVGAGLNLSYEDSTGTLTAVGTAGNRIKAKCMAVAQGTLFVGNVTEIGGSSVSYQNRVYYSLFDETNNIPGHQLYEDDETMTTSTRFIQLPEPVVALFSNSAIGQIIIFTARKAYTFDIRYAENGTGVISLFGVGCANQRSIGECNDWMIWMDRRGRIWSWGGAGKPENISWDIQDDTYADSLIDNISRSNLSSICFGADGNEFYFSVGNITFRGRSFTNCLIRGFLAQTAQVLWSLYTLPYKPLIFTNTIISNKEVLVCGCSDDNVYLLNTGTNDNGTAISAYAITPFIDFGKTYKTKTNESLLIKYRPQSADNTYLYVKYATDCNFTYTSITDPDNASPVTTYGVIDMYESDYSTRLDKIKVIGFPKGLKFRSLSLEIGNDQASEDFEISGIGYMITAEELNIRPQTI